MKRGVLFDVGGVLAYDVWEHLLCDPPPRNSADPVSISAKYDVPTTQLELLGRHLWKQFDKIPGDARQLELEYWHRLLAHGQCPAKLKTVPVSDFIAMTDDFIRPVNQAETVALLQSLKDRGIPLGICSNNNEFWYEAQEAKLGLRNFFDGHITLSCHEKTTKATDEIFCTAARRLGLPPSDCIFVDDRMDNVSRAVCCEMTGVLFPTEQFASKPQNGAQYLRRLLDSILR